MEFYLNVTIVVTNLLMKNNEELHVDVIVRRILAEIDPPDNAVRCCRRLQSRCGKPGIVKVHFTYRDVKTFILGLKLAVVVVE